MNNRSGLFTFVLFLFLAMMITLQILAMKQSDRLYERLNVLLERGAGFTRSETTQTEREKSTKNMPMPKRIGDEGDSLIISLSAEPTTLNHLVTLADTYTSNIVLGNIFERLLEYDRDEIKLKPWLAESYQVSDDGMEVTVKLRDDVCFSDGVPMTADDILFTYQTIMNPGVDAAVKRMFYSKFEDVIKIDERTVKFISKEVLWKTFEVIGLFSVYPKHIYQFDDPEEFNSRRSNPVGSGPYVFEKWDVGQQVVLRRNENYWGHKPKIRKQIYRFITNETAQLQALRSGDIDFIDQPTSEQFDAMKNDKEFNKELKALSYWMPGVPTFYIAWNNKTVFFKDRLVRLAMTHMVDRNAVVEYLLKGGGEISTGPFYIYGQQYNKSIEPWPYDIERARELLDQAGWVDTDGDGIRDKNGVPFRFKFSYSTGRAFYVQLAKLLKDAAAKVGVDVIPDPYEWSVFVEKIHNRDFESISLGFGGTIEYDPYQQFHSDQISNRGDNITGFSNPRVDKLIDIARRTLPPDERYALYHKFHKMIHKEQPYTFLYTRPERAFISRRFENVIIHKAGIDSHEWYVPKEKQKYK